MTLRRRQFLQLGAAAMAATAGAPIVRAQSYPARPIRMIVPVAAGGPVDVINRLIVQKLSERWGNQFHVENLATGAGNVATGTAAKAPADGYTVLAVTTAFVINPSLYAKLAYDPVKDFAPVTLVGASPHVMIVNPSLPANDVKELVALVKANPGKYSYASPGTGQSGQLAGEMFRLACGLDLVHVPFNGAVPAITSTIAGHTPIAFMSLAAAAGSIRDGKLRALAVTGSKRSAVFPEVPTMAEAGVPNQESVFGQGIVFPAGTPKDIIDRWHHEVVRIVALPEVKGRMTAMNLEPVANTPEEFAEWIKTEIPRWRKVIEDAKIKRSTIDPVANMDRAIDTTVLIVGAGPVGLTLALDLASRGIDVTVVEIRRAGELPGAKCNQVSARSMEIFRRLGIAGKLRAVGLPADYPNDVACRTTATGLELARIPIPSRAERFSAAEGPDTWWPTPEPPHRVNQIYLEPVLFSHAASQPRIRILHRTEAENFSQDDAGVTAIARNLDSGERLTIRCLYLVGCDGSKSLVRKKIGAMLTGTPVIQRVQSTYFRAPDLLNLLPGKRAWLYLSFNPRRCGTTIAIDGCETWQVHNWLYRGESDFDSVDRDWALRAILGVGPNFRYGVISTEDWVARRLVANRFRDRRVFICGDAAHLWIPHAGYGMNAGIADAANLSWMMAATLNSWAPAGILDAYEAERQPITDQVSRFAMDVALSNMKQRREIPPEVEWPGPIGESARARIGKEAYDLYVQQQCCGGLNFGYFYDRSPIIAYDGEPHPAYTMRDFTSSTVPGCRAPHLWLSDGRSLYDALGPDYTLIRFDSTVRVAGIVSAAAQRGVPLTVLDIAAPDAPSLYARNLGLVRPDQHVAWRGNQEPPDALELVDLVRGEHARRAASHSGSRDQLRGGRNCSV